MNDKFSDLQSFRIQRHNNPGFGTRGVCRALVGHFSVRPLIGIELTNLLNFLLIHSRFIPLQIAI